MSQTLSLSSSPNLTKMSLGSRESPVHRQSTLGARDSQIHRQSTLGGRDSQMHRQSTLGARDSPIRQSMLGSSDLNRQSSLGSPLHRQSSVGSIMSSQTVLPRSDIAGSSYLQSHISESSYIPSQISDSSYVPSQTSDSSVRSENSASSMIPDQGSAHSSSTKLSSSTSGGSNSSNTGSGAQGSTKQGSTGSSSVTQSPGAANGNFKMAGGRGNSGDSYASGNVILQTDMKPTRDAMHNRRGKTQETSLSRDDKQRDAIVNRDVRLSRDYSRDGRNQDPNLSLIHSRQKDYREPAYSRDSTPSRETRIRDSTSSREAKIRDSAPSSHSASRDTLLSSDALYSRDSSSRDRRQSQSRDSSRDSRQRDSRDSTPSRDGRGRDVTQGRDERQIRAAVLSRESSRDSPLSFPNRDSPMSNRDSPIHRDSLPSRDFMSSRDSPPYRDSSDVGESRYHDISGDKWARDSERVRNNSGRSNDMDKLRDSQSLNESPARDQTSLTSQYSMSGRDLRGSTRDVSDSRDSSASPRREYSSRDTRQSPSQKGNAQYSLSSRDSRGSRDLRESPRRDYSASSHDVNSTSGVKASPGGTVDSRSRRKFFTRAMVHHGAVDSDDELYRNWKDGPVSLHDPVDSMSSQDGHSEAKTGASSNQMHSSSANHSQASHASTNHSHSAAANDTQVNGNVVEDRKNLKNLPIEEVLVKARAVVEELGRLEEYHRGEGMRLQKMLGDFYWDYTTQRQQIGDAIADAGYAEITIKMLKSLNTIGIFKNDDVWFPAYYTYNTTWNYSDTSDCLAKNLAEADAVRLLTLNCSHKPYLTNIHSKNVYYVMKASMSILHNIARNPNVKSFFKDNKTAEVVMPFINMNDDMLRVLAMLTLAYIVEEEDNSKLIDETGTIKNVVMWIGKALDNPKRRFKGFTPQELTQGLDKLAVNDGNKPKIVEEGSIELFMKMLTSDNDKEQSTTARCMWTLAFDKDVRQQLLETENLMSTLEKLADSQVQDVKKNAQGALWVLSGKGDAPTDRPRSAPRGKNHVFISYSWNEQEKVMEIRDRLRAEGYVVWVDIEQMGGSTLQAMAEAVENAAVVLVCMSEKYKQSPNCRTEAEYTFQLRKDYIPLMMQKKYRPDGWLGMILGAKLFFDFSGKYPFEKSASGLLKELRGRGKRSNVLQGQSVDDVDTLQAREDNQLVQAGNPHRNTHPGTELALHPGHQPQAALMTRDDVQRWLVTQHLDRSIATFSQFDGRLLWQLREMKHEAPEYFYQCLERKLNLDLIDTLRLASALDTLH